MFPFSGSPRDMKRIMRQLQRMGIKMEEMKGVREVVIRLEDKEIVIEAPMVSVIEFGGSKVFNVVGEPGKVAERPLQREESKVEISEEDVELVAAQAGVSKEEARKALEEAGGDIAKAIVILEERRESGSG